MSFFRRVFNKNENDESKSQEEGNTGLPSENNPVNAETPPMMPSYNPEGQTAHLDGVTRPLAADAEQSIASGHPLFGYVSDVGMVRDNNEDATFLFYASSSSVENHPDFGLFVMADGMGGHQSGERASSIATRAVARFILDRLYLPIIGGGDSYDRPPIAEVLTAAIKSANELVMKEITDGGTTLTLMVLIGDWGHFAHVGDSRAFLVTRDGVDQLTRDHSLVQRLIELGQLTQEESRSHPQRNVLYRAIGQSDNLEVDTISRRLPPGASVLLCSDGLWDNISQHQLREIVNGNGSPQQICEKLVALASTQGSTDNISAILLRMPGT